MKAKLCNKVVDLESGRVEFDFGEAGTLMIGLDDLSEDMRRAACLHGLSQKGGDAFAGATTPEEAFEKCSTVILAIKAGSWNPGRDSSSILVEALVVVSGKSAKECREAINGLNDADVKELRKQLAVTIKTIELERLSKRTQPGGSGLLKGLFE